MSVVRRVHLILADGIDLTVRDGEVQGCKQLKKPFHLEVNLKAIVEDHTNKLFGCLSLKEPPVQFWTQSFAKFSMLAKGTIFY